MTQRKFPLEPGTNALVEGSFDLDAEEPLLIDPAKENPRDHIRYKWSEEREKWLPIPVPGSKKARKTLRILPLEDEDDHAKEHVNTRVQQCIRQIEKAVPNREKVRELWDDWMGSLFAPRQIFHAITWDVLDAKFPQSFREAYQVQLPPLGAPVHVSTSPPFGFIDPDEFQWLSDERLKLEIRAMGDRTPEDVAVALLKKVESLRSWTDAELARLFGRTQSTIARWKQRK